MFENFIESLKQFRYRWNDMLYSSLIDVTFLFAYFFLTSLIFAGISIHTINAFTIIQDNQAQFGNLNGGLSDLFSKLPNLPGFNAEFNSLVFLVIFLLIIIYLLYAVFQYFSWRIIIKDKTRRFIKFFAIANIFWVILYFAISVISSAKELVTKMQGKEITGNIFFSFIYLLTIYLAFVSYSLIPRKKALKTFSFAFRPKSLFSFFELLILCVVVDSILVVASSINSLFGLILGFPIVFVFISFSKLHISRIIEKQK